MENLTIYFKSIFLTAICLVFLSCSNTGKDKLPDPKIQAGIAMVTGQVIDYHKKKGEEIPTISLYVTNPVTAESITLETLLKDDGSFHFEVLVECDKTLGAINSSYFNRNAIFFGMVPGEVTSIEIAFDKTGKIKPEITSSFELTSDVTQNYSQIFVNFLDANEHEPFYKLTPEEFSLLAMDKLMPKRLKTAINDTVLSKKGLNLVINECKLKFLSGCLLTYSDYISLNYRNFKAKGDPEDFTPQKPKRSYYALLKSFNLNDPQYLYNFSYIEVLKSILTNETLNIPAIKDTPVNEWLKEVKTIMADLIGSNTGLVYDMLAANAYALQFNTELKPLSDKQVANIKSYFKNEEFTKILLRRNEEIIKLAKGKESFETVVNKTPAVSKETLMKTIISKYKGKAVLVDFWATWCGPCMNAMKQSAKIKYELRGKDVVFVYLTDVSSPMKLWEMNIKAIGGEQYYLTSDEMKYLQKSFDFTGIPTYLFFNKKGVLKNKVTGYPGTIKMQKMIEELL
jgi:thiol-disulfide isomerase/thioredoxin